MRNRKKKEDSSSSLKNLLDVCRYLDSEGWKVGKTFLYQKAGMLTKRKDGTITKKDADKFASAFLQRKLSVPSSTDLTKKTEAETRKLIAEAEKKELEVLKLKGEVVDRYEVEQQLAYRAAFLLSGLRSFGYSQVPRIIDAVGGDMSQAAQAIGLFHSELEKLFDYYSKPIQFRVPVNGGGDDADIICNPKVM